MSVIERNITRTILNSTETTKETNSISDDDLTFELTALDEFFIGFKKPFTTRFLGLETVNSNSITITVQYYNGTTFVAVEDLIDQTRGLTTSGFISWINQTDWKVKAQTPIDDKELFWIKLTVSGDLSASTALENVLNLFHDDTLMRSYYPEIISDTRFLPEGRTNFLEQYRSAKDLIITRLIQKRAIEEESQIIDINQVAIASVHAAAYIILDPIANNDFTKDLRDKAFENMNREINLMRFSFDVDDDGVVDLEEENVGTIQVLRS